MRERIANAVLFQLGWLACELTDDGRRVPFDGAAFAAGGLRLLRPGQRVRMDTAQGRVVRVTLVTLT